MYIAVTAGHSNTDSGAVGNGFQENKFCAGLRNIIVHYLKTSGYDVKTDGTGLVNAPLKDAIAIAKNAKVAIEIHLNASTNSKAEGIEVLANPKDKVLAQKISKAIYDVTKSPLRGEMGYKPENSGQHARLGYVRAGGLVVEVEFISNKERMKALNDKVWLVGKSIAGTLIDYMDNA